MNRKMTFRLLAMDVALLATVLLAPGRALAHCDGMDGPVVKAAQKALAEGDVNRILIWIPPKDEATIKALFQKTLAVRKLSAEAREVADIHFFETLVRIHRAGEGAPYTGVKPAGRDLGLVIPAADRAIEEGSAESLLKLLPESGRTEAHALFKVVLAKREFKVNDVEAGRQYVVAYVTFMHGVERLHGDGECDACEHKQHGKHAAEDASAPREQPKGQIHIDGKITVRDLVGRYPQTRPVFEERGIDYCCGGGQSLTDAAQKHGLELPALVAAVEKALQSPLQTSKPIDRDWYVAPLQELVNHIVNVHHTYMKRELPRLRTLEQRVLKAHGANHGEMLRQVHTLLAALDTELSAHLTKEETVVFPQILAADVRARKEASEQVTSSGSVHNPVGQLEREHESAGKTLAKLHEVTDNYTLPPDACPTFEALYDGLQQMEADLHQHIHLENNILFPRSLERER